MKYVIAALLLSVPTMGFAHDRIVNGIVVPNGFHPAWENGRVNRDTGDLNGPSFVEAGRFDSFAAAEAAAGRVGGRAEVVRGSGDQFSVLIGPYRNRDAAQRGLDAAHAAGLGHGRVR